MLDRLKAWWRGLWPLNAEDKAYLTKYQEKAERTTSASRARQKRLQRELAKWQADAILGLHDRQRGER